MAPSNILRVICSGTVQLEVKNDFYKVLSPYVESLSMCGALPRCNPANLNYRNFQRLVESFEEDVAPDLDSDLVRRCRIQLTVMEKLYYALEMLELQGVRVASKFITDLIDDKSDRIKEDARLELIGNENFMKLYLALNGGNPRITDRPAAELDNSIVKEKLHKLADVIEKHLRQTTSAGRILVAVPSIEMAQEVNKIILALPQNLSSFLYDMRHYSRDVHKRFVMSDDRCIVVVSDPSLNKAPFIEISDVELAICCEVPKTSLRKVPKWKGSIYMLLTDVENRSFHEKTLLVEEPVKSGSANVKESLAKQATIRGRSGHLTKKEQQIFDRDYRTRKKIVLPESGTPRCPTSSQRGNVRQLSLIDWIPWQRQLQPTSKVGHSEDTQAMADSFALCDDFRRKGDIDEYEKTLVTHLCFEDVIEERNKAKRFPTTKADNLQESMDCDDEEMDFCALTDTMKHYVLDSENKISRFLREIHKDVKSDPEDLDENSDADHCVKDSAPENYITSLPETGSSGTTSQKVDGERCDVRRDAKTPKSISPKRSGTTIFGQTTFEEISTPELGRRLPTTSTPFVGTGVIQKEFNISTPFRRNDDKSGLGGGVSCHQPIEVTESKEASKLGVTALVNFVQKRKKQKNLQHFFRSQTEPAKPVETAKDEPIIVESDDDDDEIDDSDETLKKTLVSQNPPADLDAEEESVAPQKIVSNDVKTGQLNDDDETMPELASTEDLETRQVTEHVKAISFEEEEDSFLSEVASTIEQLHAEKADEQKPKPMAKNVFKIKSPSRDFASQKQSALTKKRSVFDALEEHKQVKEKPRQSVNSVFALIEEVTARNARLHNEVAPREVPQPKYARIFSKDFDENEESHPDGVATQKSEDSEKEIRPMDVEEGADQPTNVGVNKRKGFVKQKLMTGKAGPSLNDKRLFSSPEERSQKMPQNAAEEASNSTATSHRRLSQKQIEELSKMMDSSASPEEEEEEKEDRSTSVIRPANVRNRKTAKRQLLTSPSSDENPDVASPDDTFLDNLEHKDQPQKQRRSSGKCREERRPKKKPRCEFIEEEADVESSEVVSSDGDEGEDYYELNSFMDDNSKLLQTQGMYLAINAHLPEREAKRPVMNMVPIEECFSQTPTEDDASYDSDDSFIAKGEITDATLPLEITVMHQEKEEAKPHRTKSSTKTKTKKKRRKVFMLSQSDDHEEHSTQQQTNDPPSRVAPSSSSSRQPTKQQHPHHQPKPTKPKNDAVANVRPPSPRPSGSSQLKLVIVNIQLMTILPDILVGLGQTFQECHIEPVDMTSLEDHQADLYVGELCVKILEFSALASERLNRKTRHRLSQFKQLSSRPVLILYTAGISSEMAAQALPIHVHLLRTNIRMFYAASQVEILMLLKCLVRQWPSSASKILNFIDSPDLKCLLEVPQLNIVTASLLLAEKKTSKDALRCSAEEIAKICGVPHSTADGIFNDFKLLKG